MGGNLPTHYHTHVGRKQDWYELQYNQLYKLYGLVYNSLS